MTVILAIEASCDETAVAVVIDGQQVAGERVASQAGQFAEWGGVVPEIAARGHVAWLPDLVDAALADAAIDRETLDAVAVGAWPGLMGGLLCAVTCAKTIALRYDLPLLAIDHVQAHLAAVHLGRSQVPYPFVGLVASGGHSHYYRCTAPGRLDLLGGTIDDAAGEAYDKVATMLELGYPGGPAIDTHAQRGNPTAFTLPRPFRHDPAIKLSFAGLKTALLYRVRGPRGRDPLNLDPAGIDDACAVFQAAAVDCLAGKLRQAFDPTRDRALAVGGGVACNHSLRQRLRADAEDLGVGLLLPEPRHCTDNAAMIGALGYFHYREERFARYDLVPLPTGRAGPRG